MRVASFAVALLLALPTFVENLIQADELPPVSDRKPVEVSHFPDVLHAVVWRNWGLVEVEHLAAVLRASPQEITQIAASMGLPQNVSIAPQMLERGYITLIRRNWHLLPYEQLTQLLEMTPQQLAFTLREDDFLYIKLGSLKPDCGPVVYSEPTDEAKHRTAEIKQIVDQHFRGQLEQPGIAPFSFVAAFRDTPTPSEATTQTADNAKRLRFVYSYFALFGDPLSKPELDPYPDGLLAQLRDRGVNGIWMHVVLRQLAPGGPNFPEWGEGHERRLENLKLLVERAKRFGIDVYLYMNEPRAMPTQFFANRPEMAGMQDGNYRAVCTSDRRVRQWLTDSLAFVFQKVPHLGGIFTITASENLTSCASHGRRNECPRCKLRSDSVIIAEVNRAMQEGVHRSAPNAKVIVWDWCWQEYGHATATIEKLPDAVWLMSVSEWALPIERGGVKSEIGEYALSVSQPGPRALRHWQLAKARGLKTVAKTQFNNTWELSSVPYLPVMNLVAEHCEKLAHAETDGLMLSWSLGGYPSINLELVQQFSNRPVPSAEAVLQTVAERNFGVDAAPYVRQAWEKFSQAFREYPYSTAGLYRGPQQLGPANLLYAQPTGYTATMVCFPYDDLSGWCGPYSPSVYASQYEKVAAGWQQGLADLSAAQPLVPEHLRAAAAADLRVAQAAQVHFASSANQAKFIMARNALATTEVETEKQLLRNTLIDLLDQEIALAKQLFTLARSDSRLGFEASNHYGYLPHDLVEKVLSCQRIQSQLRAVNK